MPRNTNDGRPEGSPLGGPLSRLREQLAGPRGYRRIDALLSTDNAAAAVAALSPNEVFELVHEVGFQDAQPLIELATPEQIQGCFDLDAWNQDDLTLAPLWPWFVALSEVGFEKLGGVWAHLDSELRALILQRSVTIYDTTLEEAPAEDSEQPAMTTPDRFFILELGGDAETQRVVQQVVEDLYRFDPDLARHTIMAARSEPPAELAEASYRWRKGRLADLGYADFYDALELFRPLRADQVQIGEGSHYRTTGDPATRLPIVVAEELISKSFLARALAAIEDPLEAERIETAMMHLINRVLAAGRAKPGHAEVLRRGAVYATATLSLGLETVSRGALDHPGSGVTTYATSETPTELERATEALRTISLNRLFRVGYTVTQRLAKLATALAPRSRAAGSPTVELVAALCSPRPLFARAADDPPATGLRPFESTRDLGRAGELLTGLAIRIAVVESLGVDVLAMSQSSPKGTSSAAPPKGTSSGGASGSAGVQPELDDHIRTALVRALIGDEFSGAALSQAELTTLRTSCFSDEALTVQARRAGHAAVALRLEAAQLAATGPVLAKLVDGWLDDLEQILGKVKDREIDPRFVDGVLVEVKRS